MLLTEISDDDCYLVDPRGGPTSEDPPRPVPERAETIGIDDYLGLYLPEEQLIKVFSKNIDVTSKRLNCSPFVLRYVVHYHEQAHALVHLGTYRKQKDKALTNGDFLREQLRDVTARFHRIEEGLQECLAQLLAYHAVQRVGEKLRRIGEHDLAADFLTVFATLMKIQPPRYRVEQYLEVPAERIIGSIELLRTGDLAARMSPWSTIMKWP